MVMLRLKTMIGLINSYTDSISKDLLINYTTLSPAMAR